jgi:hypothetical protein
VRNLWNTGILAASSTNKRVLVVRFDRETVTGVVSPQEMFQGGVIEVLSLGGTLVTIPLSEAKAVCYVKDLPTQEAWKPNRFFSVRPKMEGLWLRFKFRDDDAMEGVFPNNLLLLEPAGFQVIPPDPSFLNQRIFVPRSALVETQVLGVIGSPLRRLTPAKAAAKPQGQIGLFDSEG